MKLSISNIAWLTQDDEKVFELMSSYGFEGLEIAPTRIIPQNPYDNIYDAKEKLEKIRQKYGFEIPSMQSIWFGRSEKIFGPATERSVLIEYTKKAIDWAEAIGCRNLVFGCPRNRVMPEDVDENIGISFFKEIGDYAATHNCIIGMEANPPIYNTNYINDTASAIRLIKAVDSKGFGLNLDVGTMLACDETVEVIANNINLISHVHISEPGLAAINRRDLHTKLIDSLANGGYRDYISIEMGNANDFNEIEKALRYLAEIVGK